MIELAAETAPGRQTIGTTRRGIGPAYEDKIHRNGLRVVDLLNTSLLRTHINNACHEKNTIAHALFGTEPLDPKQMYEDYARARRADRALRHRHRRTCSTTPSTHGQNVMFEGAQGALLDIDHGTYPFVTSSSSTAGGAVTGTGVGPTRIGTVIGVTKAYVTRVGEGPFPTEIDGHSAELLRARGQEYGAVTGRPRRCGWLDLPLLRYSNMINSTEWLVVTKMDVMDECAEIPVCTGYKIDGKVTDIIPADIRGFKSIEPIYTTLKGWKCSTEGITEYDKLPKLAQEYLQFIERETGAKIGMISTGPDRVQTINPARLRRTAWLGIHTTVLLTTEYWTPMISFTVRMTFRPDDREEIHQILRELTRLSRQEPGCVSYIPHFVESDPDTIVIYEQYTRRSRSRGPPRHAALRQVRHRRPVPEDAGAQRRKPHRHRLSLPSGQRTSSLRLPASQPLQIDQIRLRSGETMSFHSAVTKNFDVASISGLTSGTPMLRRLPIRMFLVAMAACFVAALPYASAQDHQHREHKRAERAQIVALEKEWQRAALADDLPAMDKLLSDDYLGITATGEVLTKTQQLARMRDRKFMLSKLEISDTRIKLIGNIAIVTCLAQVEGTSEDEPLHGAYRYTRVYQRLAGNVWKVTNFEVTAANRPHRNSSSPS